MSLAGKQFVLVEDVESGGGAIIDALAKLRSDGLVPRAALWVIDRETRSKGALAAVGLEPKALFTFTQLESVT